MAFTFLKQVHLHSSSSSGADLLLVPDLHAENRTEQEHTHTGSWHTQQVYIDMRMCMDGGTSCVPMCGWQENSNASAQSCAWQQLVISEKQERRGLGFLLHHRPCTAHDHVHAL